jgi:hypothetical protein
MHAIVEEYTPTSTARSAIRTGDLVMFRDGTPLRDKIIELGTGAYFHSALAYHETDADRRDRVWLVQATKERGVHTRLMSEQLDARSSVVEHWRVKEPWIAKYTADVAIAAGRAMVGKPYAMVPMYWFALDVITLGLLRLRSRARSKKAFFCSELVAWAARRGGVRLDPTHGMAATTPSDLLAHKRVKPLGAFALPAVVATLT